MVWSRKVSCRLDTVIMDCRGLVYPQNKPFGRVLLGSADQDHVLGGVHTHQRQAEEGATTIHRVAQMRCHRLPTTTWRGSMVESSGGAVTCAQEKWLSSLSSNI